jgi:formiminoglutamase
MTESGETEPVVVMRGESPVILAMPHVGTRVPPEIFRRLNAEGQVLRDADWRVDRLYEGLLPGATVVRATIHRYVIDVNRDPSGASLYPGQNTTGLIPLTNFDGEPIWRAGEEPDAQETARRLNRYHAAYHRALSEEVARVKATRGVAVLYDCHSIRSRIPHLFEGLLPDLNIGTNDGRTAAPKIEAAARDAAAASGFTHVVNGRFKGGWTTRRYGAPGAGVHAIQMELAQRRYLASEEPPFDYHESEAEHLRETLRDILAAIEEIALRMSAGDQGRGAR